MDSSNSRRVERKCFRIFTISIYTFFIFSLLLLPSISALTTTTYKSELSDLFNDASLNTTTLWLNSSYRNIAHAFNVFSQIETTSYVQSVSVGGNGANNDIMECWTYSNYSYKNITSRNYDIYLNLTSTGYTGAALLTSQMGIVFFNETTTIPTQYPTWLIYWLKQTTVANAIWHVFVNNTDNTIIVYNQDGSVNSTTSVSGNTRRIGWFAHLDEGINDANQYGPYSITIYNYSVFEIYTPVIELSQTYNLSAWETSSQTFIDKIFIDNESYNNVSATFYYDGVSYSANASKISSSNWTITSTIDIPTVTVTRNATFNWSLNLSGSSGTDTYSTSNYQQTINNTAWEECNATSGPAFLNFTTFEEGTWKELNSSIEFVINYWIGNSTTYETFVYSSINQNKSKYNFCFSPSSANVRADGVVDYYYDIDPITNTTYSHRSYYLDNIALTSAGTYIPLYLLTENSSTPFTFTVIDENYNPISNAYVRIMRWDVGTGNFYTVTMVKTDLDGKGVGLIRLNDAWYKYQVIYNGKLYLETEPAIEYTTSRTLQIVLTSGSPYLQYDSVSWNFAYNNNTQTFTFSFADASGSVATGCLKISKIDNSSVLYYNCVYSTSGTLSYTLTENGTYVGDAILRLTANYSSVEKVMKSIMVTLGTPERFLVIGTYGRVASILLIGTLGMIGVASGSLILAVFLVIAGIVVSWLIGLIYFSPTVIFTLIAVGLIILVLARRRTG